MTHRRSFTLVARLIAALLLLTAHSLAGDLGGALKRAGRNAFQLRAAIARVPKAERDAMRWLVAHMPDGDLSSLTSEYLIANHTLAFEAWRTAPWRDDIDEALFLDAVLPYASVNERRDAWRKDLRERCLPMVAEAKSASEAAALLNNAIWSEFNVKYSTLREKPHQSPFETMESGLASCTGLSVLLIDACRSVGVPARFVGTPSWSDDSGNHSWVEVWDDGWHFTGAGEPTGMQLDQSWFVGRAASSDRDDPKYAIYATTWRNVPLSFPMSWKPEEESVGAVNVTERYTQGAPSAPQGSCIVLLRVMRPSTAKRTSTSLIVRNCKGELVFEGTSRDERFDLNDHVEVQLLTGETYYVEAELSGAIASLTLVAHDGLLSTLRLPGGNCTTPGPGWSLLPKTKEPLAQLEAERLRKEHWSQYAEKVRSESCKRLAAQVLMDGEVKLPFWYTVYGEKPAGGRSLYISMHGGGGAPTEVNDQQWENQKKLYTPEEGVYLVPRAPTDTWNLWHQAHIDDFFDSLIQTMVVIEGVNPDRVYLLGYSAGGDGVYQLAPRMADRFAAVAMMAGHPNETQPDGLRNLPFTLHMGGEDSAYDRNKIAREWKTKLAELAVTDEGGYEHLVEIHEGKGHWMDGEDAVALTWMAEHARNLRPHRIVWLQDDVTHQRFYWLRNPEPKPRERIVAQYEGQVFTIIEAPPGTTLEIRLDDSMCDLDSEVLVRFKGIELFRGIVPRTSVMLAKTLEERGDPRGVFCSEIRVTLPVN